MGRSAVIPASDPARRALLLGLLGVAALTLLRAPSLLAAPRFWAEEGAIYFAFAFQHGFWESLLAPQLGYFSLVPNAATAAASLVPLEDAPAVTTAVAASVQMLASGVALTVSSRFLRGWPKPLAVALAIQLLAPMEALLTTIAAQFWLAIASFAVLLDETPAVGRARRWGFRALLAVGGLTGVVSCFLLPFFAWKALRSGEREDRVRAAILCGAAVAQGIALLSTLGGGDSSLASRFGDSELSIPWLLIHQFVAPVLGPDLFQSGPIRALNSAITGSAPQLLGPDAQPGFPFATLAALVLVPGSCLILGLRGLRDRDERPIWLAFLTVVALSTLLSIRMQSSPRYAFVPSVILFTLFLAQLRPGIVAWRRSLGGALALAMLLSNAYDFRSRVYAGETLPRWRDEVAHWRRDPGYALLIWPQFPGASWSLTLAEPK